MLSPQPGWEYFLTQAEDSLSYFLKNFEAFCGKKNIIITGKLQNTSGCI
jgi:hypothetical protein